MVTLVSGNMRCGSSLVMRMLGAGGMPLCYTQPESFEHDRCLAVMAGGDLSWVREAEGKALKWLDPLIHGGPPKSFDYRTIVLTRDATWQHRSQVHFLSMLGHGVQETRAARRMLAKDNGALAGFWKKYGAVLSLTFEEIITQPHGSAVVIAAFLSDVPLDIDAMRAQVLDRPTRCTDAPWELDVIPSASLWRPR